MTRNLVILFSGLATVICLMSSCHQDSLYDNHHLIENSIWPQEAFVKFDVPVVDTTLLYSFFVNVRNNNDYPYANIYFFVNTIFPNGRVVRDTAEYVLADEKGRWLGTGIGGVKYSSHLFKQGVRFPVSGTYSFIFEQGMREDVKGIMDIGIRIEKR